MTTFEQDYLNECIHYEVCPYREHCNKEGVVVIKKGRRNGHEGMIMDRGKCLGYVSRRTMISLEILRESRGKLEGRV